MVPKEQKQKVVMAVPVGHSAAARPAPLTWWPVSVLPLGCLRPVCLLVLHCHQEMLLQHTAVVNVENGAFPLSVPEAEGGGVRGYEQLGWGRRCPEGEHGPGMKSPQLCGLALGCTWEPQQLGLAVVPVKMEKAGGDMLPVGQLCRPCVPVPCTPAGLAASHCTAPPTAPQTGGRLDFWASLATALAFPLLLPGGPTSWAVAIRPQRPHVWD